MKKVKFVIISLILFILSIALIFIFIKNYNQKKQNSYFSKQQIIKEQQGIENFLKSLSE